MEDSADLPSRLPPEERTLPRMLRRQAALYGNRRLVEISGHAWTFAETLEIAARFGGTLRAFGIERDDRVAVMCGNRQELLQVYLGCGWIGAVTVPINTASRGAQLGHILSNSQAKLLVLQAEFADAVDLPEIELPLLRAVWLIGDANLAESWPRPTRFPAPRGARAGSGDRARRYGGDPLHVGHDRRLKGSMLPARPVLLVGREYGATPRAALG